MTVGRAAVIDCGLIGGINFARIMPAQAERANLLVGVVLNHSEQTRIGAKDVLADVGAGLNA